MESELAKWRRLIAELGVEIEKLPASEQQTKVSILASDIGRMIQEALRAGKFLGEP